MFPKDAVHRCSPKWSKRHATLLKNDSNAEQLFYRTPLVAASIAKTNQKKQEDILRKDALQIFLLKHNNTKKQN